MTADVPDEVLLPFISRHSPLGRLGMQHELDAAVLFLASPASSYSTGTTLRGRWHVRTLSSASSPPRSPGPHSAAAEPDNIEADARRPASHTPAVRHTTAVPDRIETSP
ncbi:hypothetical protein [Rhodococcus opacus]|uniref:hypothetical protein n=1 Tax=Rhodococcus opacus TaxID=37919 RepID=UPI00217ECA74|nr:hypothetical protein [Rhodococcus opacus]